MSRSKFYIASVWRKTKKGNLQKSLTCKELNKNLRYYSLILCSETKHKREKTYNLNENEFKYNKPTDFRKKKTEEPRIKSIFLPNICGLDRLNIYKE